MSGVHNYRPPEQFRSPPHLLAKGSTFESLSELETCEAQVLEFMSLVCQIAPALETDEDRELRAAIHDIRTELSLQTLEWRYYLAQVECRKRAGSGR